MHGLAGAALLSLPLGDHAKLPVMLNPALARLLCAMHQARKKDKHEAPEVRGWRAAERLGKDVAKLLRFAPVISPQAVTKYVWEIKREIRLAAEEQGPDVVPPALIESRRGWGYRVAVEDLTIIDRSEDA
jgi:hypothetical protein